jgi:malate synthase
MLRNVKFKLHKPVQAYMTNINHHFKNFSTKNDKLYIRPVSESHKYLIEDKKFNEFVADIHHKFKKPYTNLIKSKEKLDNIYSNPDNWCLREDLVDIRKDNTWYGAEIPNDLTTRHVEITGPLNNPKMVLNALNSGADGYMGDLEDSLSPSWANIVNSMDNVYKVCRNELEYSTDDNPKTYKLNNDFKNSSTFHLRPRGLHLYENNVKDSNGDPVPAMIWDISSHIYHNFNILDNTNLYIPKLETYEDSVFVAELLKEIHHKLDYDLNKTKVTALIETFPAIFQSEEIIYGLRDNIVGLNCGRWDYIYSLLKYQKNNEDMILPDRNNISMDKEFMQSYINKIVYDCNKRGITPMGGMSAFLPSKNAFVNKSSIEKIEADKNLEKKLGVHGAWVAHPGLISTVKNIFNVDNEFNKNPIFENFIQNNSRQSIKHLYLNTSYKDNKNICNRLIDIPEDMFNRKKYTYEGLLDNINVSLIYLDKWLDGLGAVAINGLMEDMATAEISCHQIKQWLTHKIYVRNKSGIYDEVNEQLIYKIINEHTDSNEVTKDILYKYIVDDKYKYLADIAYPYLDRIDGFKGIEFTNDDLNILTTDYSKKSGIEITKHRGDYLTEFLYQSNEKYSYYQFLGTSTGISAVNVVAGGGGKVGPYSGGWQANAMKNRLNECLPDTLHVVPEEPAECAKELNNHLIRADAIQELEYKKGNLNKLHNNYQDIALLADLEQGWSVPEKVRMSVKRCIDNGINVIHIEDQGERKRCGHLGDKELATIEDYKMILKSANLAAQELLGTDQAHNQWVRFVARTDAYSAKRIANSSNLHDLDHPEHIYIDWKRGTSQDGKYLYLKQGINPQTGNTWGLDIAIGRGIEVIKNGLASHVWMETPNADLGVAKAFMDGVNNGLHKHGLKAHGLYNHSPSFDWDLKFFNEAKQLADSIVDWVETQSDELPLIIKIENLKSHLEKVGSNIQGDHLYSNDALEKILIYATNTITTPQNQNKSLQSLNNILNDKSYSESLYGFEIKQFLDKLVKEKTTSMDKLQTVIVGERLRLFEPQLASFGYNLHLITLPEFHVLAHNMYHLSKDFSQEGIKAYVTQVQRPEYNTYTTDPSYTYYKHQTATGTGLEAKFSETVGSSDTNILADSTESDDLNIR